MRMTVRHRWRWVILAAALLATACGGVFGKTYPAYRYRVTVEVETPQGLRRGSSVIEVQTTAGGPYSISGGGGGGIATRVTGEAAAIDLPNGETLFMLITGGDGSLDWATNAYALEVPYPTKAEVEARTGAGQWNENAAFDLWMERVEDSHGRLPLRRWRIFGASKMSGWPMLVRFKNIHDPASVESVDPDDLGATLGKGYRVRDVYVEKTDAPVNAGITTRLPWLNPSMGTLGPHPRNSDGSFVPWKESGLAAKLRYIDFQRLENGQ